MGADLDDRGILRTCSNCGTRNRWLYGQLEKRIRCGRCKTELPPIDTPLEVQTASQFRSVTQGPLPVLVDFWAPWCGPCKMVAPEISKVAAASAGDLLVLKLNTESVPEVAAEFRISSIPSLVLFRSGREVNRFAGARPAAEILRFARGGL